MKALVFGTRTQPYEPPAGYGDNKLVQALATTPCALKDIDDAKPLRADWYVTTPLLTGICGSDSKQILMDFGEDESDNAMSGLCSFPQVMGHEVVATITAAGPEADGFEIGQRVILNPWLSCAPRGITPLCPSCQAGDYSLCWNFSHGDISNGIHTGVSSDATGGYAELMPAHSTMLFAVPDAVDNEHAIFADPFSVSLHSITRHPPPEGGKALVWGAGALGSCAVAILRALYPSVEVAVVARFDAQAALARQFGAHHVVKLDGQTQTELVEELAAWSGGVLVPPMQGLPGIPMCHPGFIDVAYDTIGKPQTFEVEVRVLKARGTLVKSGVHAAGRWEWSPLYFKEISWVGSNAFGIEEVDGVRKHGIEHYVDLVIDGRIDLTGMLTHTFGLSQWQEAFFTIADQEHTGAIKVAIDPSR
jgi:threonine dehydrogenase-like Zn-dependent dehydrogenase